MKKRLLILAGLAIFIGSFTLIQAQDYVGSDACSTCHPDKYDTWALSGHPYKFSVIQNGQPPYYPPQVTNVEDSWMANLGDGTHDWSQIAGVIGGYGWKARFVGTDGHVVGTAGSAFSTGLGHNQFNFYDGVDYGWVDYVPGDTKIYNYSCFKCHTTGGDTTGTWLAGVEGLGTFTEGGIGCESCHGPGSIHVASPTADNIDRVYEFAHLDNTSGGLSIDGVVQTPDPNGDDVNFLCGTCHNRSYTNPINSSGGFIKHHEQWDEFVTTKHNEQGFTCVTCHDPHVSVLWGGEGVTIDCETCHVDQAAHIDHAVGVGCIDCHMPYAAKSGTTRGESGYKGDIRSHIFDITVDTNSMFTADGSAVKDDDERDASLSLHFACLGCHNDDPNDAIPDMTIEEAANKAGGMHNETAVNHVNLFNLGIFPNPSNGVTRIAFTLPNAKNINLNIFNATGQLVYSLDNQEMSAGNQSILWNGLSNTGADILSGYYYVKVFAGNQASVQKLVIIK